MNEEEIKSLEARIAVIEAHEAARQKGRRRALRWATLSVLVAAPLGTLALPTRSVFMPGQVISATAVNENFANLWQAVEATEGHEARIGALEGVNAASRIQALEGRAAPGTYCGTTGSTTGAISFNSLTGYRAAKALCELLDDCGASAHMCTSDEIVRSVANGTSIPTGWYAAGDWYDVHDECAGYTAAAGGKYGPMWQGSAPSYLGCVSSAPVLCCN
jgi:hypothetical protein